jgi:rhodanese-related sulfurtransferase
MTHRILAGIALLLGLLALAPSRELGPPAAPPHPARREVTAVQLAEWIRDRKPGLRIVDTRTQAEFDEYHLPRSERRDTLDAANPNETIVLVTGEPRQKNVYVLRGGIAAWIDDVMNPTITAGASPAARAAFARASIVSRYFGGVSRLLDEPRTAFRHDAAAVRRRGC